MTLKLHIPESNDWKTDTDNNTINAFRELMIENNEYQDDPMVGIFWYDPDENDLFGIYSIDAEDTNYFNSTIDSLESDIKNNSIDYNIAINFFYELNRYNFSSNRISFITRL